jgi:hypothetical protein
MYCDNGACRVDTRRPAPFCSQNSDCACGSVCSGGVCRISCDPSITCGTVHPQATDAYCMSVDFQFTRCDTTGGNICRYNAEVSAQCSRSSDCPTGQTCVNAHCQ